MSDDPRPLPESRPYSNATPAQVSAPAPDAPLPMLALSAEEWRLLDCFRNLPDKESRQSWLVALEDSLTHEEGV